jgi:hypothetical protein
MNTLLIVVVLLLRSAAGFTLAVAGLVWFCGYALSFIWRVDFAARKIDRIFRRARIFAD